MFVILNASLRMMSVLSHRLHELDEAVAFRGHARCGSKQLKEQRPSWRFGDRRDECLARADRVGRSVADSSTIGASILGNRDRKRTRRITRHSFRDRRAVGRGELAFPSFQVCRDVAALRLTEEENDDLGLDSGVWRGDDELRQA